jgi:hypothetical protein
MSEKLKKAPKKERKVRYPTEAEFKAIVQRFELKPEQVRALNHAIARAVSSIKDYEAKNYSPEERKHLVGRIKTMEQLLRKLLYEMDRSLPDMQKYLPTNVLETIGHRSSTSFIRETLGTSLFEEGVGLNVKFLADQDNKIGLEEIEMLCAPVHAAAGLMSGPKLMHKYIKDIHAALVMWLQANKNAGNGRRPLIFRQYIVLCLAAYAVEITGKDAPKASTGRFVDLCLSVLSACGLSIKGAEKSIPSIVAKLRPSK